MWVLGDHRISAEVTAVKTVAELQLCDLVSRPRPTALLPTRSYGKPEAAAAVDRLPMMGTRMPETR